MLTKYSFIYAYTRRLADITERSEVSILDVGSGYGFMVQAALNRGCDVYTIEPRLECLSPLLATGIDCNKIAQCRLTRGLFDKKFDVIMCITVLDEVFDKISFIEILKSYAKQETIFYIEVRNSSYLGMNNHGFATDLDLQNYMNLFKSEGFHLLSVGGASRPLTFTKLHLLFKTIFAR